MGDEHLAQHLGREFLCLLGRLAKMHAAFEAVLESPLAPAAGVNLGLDDQIAPANFTRHGFGFLRSMRYPPGRARNAKLLEEFLGLILVNIHAGWRAGDNGTPRATT